MKKLYRCTNCGFKVKVRDELSEDYICPDCGAPRDKFVEVDRDRPPILLLILYLVAFGILIFSGIFTISAIFNQDKIPFYEIETNPNDNYDDNDKPNSGENNNQSSTDSLTLELVGRNDANITLPETYPMSDEKAKDLPPYEFKIKNPGKSSMNYRLKLIDVPDNELTSYDIIKGKTRIDNSYIKFSLINGNTMNVVNTSIVSDLNDKIIASGTIKPGETLNFNFRVWMHKDADNRAQNKFYAGRIVLEAESITE